MQLARAWQTGGLAPHSCLNNGDTFSEVWAVGMNCEGKGKMEGKNSFLKFCWEWIFLCGTCLEATFCEVIKLNLKLLSISNHVTTIWQLQINVVICWMLRKQSSGYDNVKKYLIGWMRENNRAARACGTHLSTILRLSLPNGKIFHIANLSYSIFTSTAHRRAHRRLPLIPVS